MIETGTHEIHSAGLPAVSKRAAARRTISICDTQPVTAEGVRTLLKGSEDLRFAKTCDSPQQAAEWMHEQPPDVLILDKSFGIQSILNWLQAWKTSPEFSERVGIVIWGISVTEAEALRFRNAGARGILSKSAGVEKVLACLRTVAAGRTWMENYVFRDAGPAYRLPGNLTSREQQVLELVEQGYKNKEIASDLGIRPGTVKIHLKHVFEKTGVRGRHGLALTGTSPTPPSKAIRT